mmetsp:Transcript_27905/g.83759  ORF Transcript_27905/g.83759 Transcript_27905/m.83759 type:complete len:158 (+) Transcript_27905:82-555(+)
MGCAGPAGAAPLDDAGGAPCCDHCDRDDAPGNCELDAVSTKSDESETLVLAALAACDLADGPAVDDDRSSVAKKEPQRWRSVSRAPSETPAPRRGFLAAGSHARDDDDASDAATDSPGASLGDEAAADSPEASLCDDDAAPWRRDGPVPRVEEVEDD